jgi:hypothetical protein
MSTPTTSPGHEPRGSHSAMIAQGRRRRPDLAPPSARWLGVK